MEPIGLKFIPETGEKKDIANIGSNEESESKPSKSAKALKAKDKERLEEISIEKEITILGEKESTESNKEEKIVGVEIKEEKNRLRPPSLQAVDSGPDSLTWQLSELDPELEVERFQVRGESCQLLLTS